MTLQIKAPARLRLLRAWRALPERIEAWRKLFLNVAVIVSVTLIVGATLAEVTEHRVVVQPLRISTAATAPTREDTALTSAYIAAIREIITTSRSLYPVADVSALDDDDLQDIEIEGEAGLIRNALRVAASHLGFGMTRIRVDLVLWQAHPRLVVSASGPRRREAFSYSTPLDGGTPVDVLSLVDRAARATVEHLAPVTFAVYLHRTGTRVEDVADAARRMLQSEEKNERAWAYNLWGFADLGAERPAAALRKLRRAVELNPSFPVARYNLGLAYQQLGQPDAALREYALALNGPPSLRARVHYNMAVIYHEMKQFAEARRGYQAALSAAPYFPAANISLGHLDFDQGRSGEGAEWFRNAADQQPNDASRVEVYAVWAGRVESTEGATAAVAVWREASEQLPQSAAIWLNLAESLVRAGSDTADARKALMTGALRIVSDDERQHVERVAQLIGLKESERRR